MNDQEEGRSQNAGAGLSPLYCGIYIYRIVSVNDIVSRKMILVRKNVCRIRYISTPGAGTILFGQFTNCRMRIPRACPFSREARQERKGGKNTSTHYEYIDAKL